MGKTNYVYSARRVKRNAFLLPDGQKKQISLYHQIGKTKGVFSVRRVKQNVFIPPNGNKTKCVSTTRWAKRKVFFLSHGSNKMHFFRQTGKTKCSFLFAKQKSFSVKQNIIDLHPNQKKLKSLIKF